MPAGMLAPSAWEAPGPAARSASAISRVVVVLPLVADTRITSRWFASLLSRSGSRRRATLPPITDPLPRPAAFDTAAAALPAVTAHFAPGDSGSEFPPIVSRSSPHTGAAPAPRGTGGTPPPCRIASREATVGDQPIEIRAVSRIPSPLPGDRTLGSHAKRRDPGEPGDGAAPAAARGSGAACALRGGHRVRRRARPAGRGPVRDDVRGGRGRSCRQPDRRGAAGLRVRLPGRRGPAPSGARGQPPACRGRRRDRTRRGGLSVAAGHRGGHPALRPRGGGGRDGDRGAGAGRGRRLLRALSPARMRSPGRLAVPGPAGGAAAAPGGVGGPPPARRAGGGGGAGPPRRTSG